MEKFEELRILKRLREKIISRLYNTLEDVTNKEAMMTNKLPGHNNERRDYNIDVVDFKLILNNSYGYLVYNNKPTVDNCYVHELVSVKATIFKTVTEKKIYFDF